MLGFLRRRRGRGSALGPAVTGIPSGPVVHAPLAAPAVPPSVVVPVAVAPAVAVPPVVPAQSGPHVELGFRDGSRAALDPASEEAQALDELARLLAGRP